MLLNILKYGDPVLRKKAAPVTEFNTELKKTADDMFYSMYANNGIGLAANQVGILKQLLVLDASKEEKPLVFVLVNPKIIENSREKSNFEEGCLSFPGLNETIRRPLTIKVKFQDLTGKETLLEASGLLATVIQHELDHLNGILFIDRMTPVRRLLHSKELKEIKKLSKKTK